MSKEYLENFLEEFYADVLYDFEERVINALQFDNVAKEIYDIGILLYNEEEDIDGLINYAYGLKNMYMMLHKKCFYHFLIMQIL